MNAPLSAIREHVIDLPDGTLFAVEAGAGNPILMLHGWPLDHRMFRDQFDTLADAFRVVAIDRRGFGRSTTPADMSRELDDIDRWLDHLNLGAVHLLGVSQGGRVALRYAATRGSNLRSLLLQGAVVDGVEVIEPEHERVPIADYSRLAQEGRLDVVKERWLQHPMMHLPEDRTGERAWLARIVADYGGSDLLSYDPSHYRVEIDVLPAIEASALPVLVLTGARETASRKRHAREILSGVARAREVIIHGGGHLGNIENPTAFNRAVRKFCCQIDGLSSTD